MAQPPLLTRRGDPPPHRLRLLVRAAFCAAIDKFLLPRLRADERACRANAGFDAAAEPSRRSAFSDARDRVGVGFALRCFEALVFFPFCCGKAIHELRSFYSLIAMA